MNQDLAERVARNPILRPQDLRPSAPGFEITCLLNPGVFQFDHKTWLVVRVAERPVQMPGKTSFPVLTPWGGMEILEFNSSDPRLDLSDPRVISYDGRDYLTTLSHLRLLSSDDGVSFRELEPPQRLVGNGELEAFGIEDCRVARIDETYCLTYTQVSSHGVGVGLRTTRDWKTFVHEGMIFPPHNKDCALFEERIGGKYFALHRPSSPELGGNYIWLAESPDLIHWGRHRCVALTRENCWDSARVGAGASPIRTEEGWLEIYHGATSENRYCLGALLLHLNQPWRVLARSGEPIMEPLAPYEQEGFLGQVIFTNGQVVEGDRLTIYYGAADSVICAARMSIASIIGSLAAVKGATA
ncbi:MAG TPA: glycoside hydrolase family 130 protein [Terracidiphilus sp.]|nr:glycoside hydrolase family 130 protein [Terracidiphilus sp.]